MNTKEDVLKKCTVSGNVVKLPDTQLERKLYQDVAKSLQLIGGKWTGGKVFGFVFPVDPSELLEQIANGDKRNLKKEFQFFATPEHLANRLVKLANINASHLIMEPSAGQGAIIKAIQKEIPNTTVCAFELMDINKTFLQKMANVELLGNDFLKEAKSPLYNQFDRIIANPPFSNNQDIDHICKIYMCCKPGGRIVTIAGKHWQIGQENKCKQFREWLSEINAEIIEIEAGTFKESGTNISTCILIIDKPLGDINNETNNQFKKAFVSSYLNTAAWVSVESGKECNEFTQAAKQKAKQDCELFIRKQAFV